MANHQLFDFPYWSDKFPWDEIQTVYQHHNYDTPHLRHITSPVDILVAETLRGEQGADPNSDHSTATDIYTFGLGAPKDLSTTKIGGTPFRSASKPWPKFREHDYSFLAQFNFRDSRDLIGDTPGDILLIFVLENDFTNFHFEWSDGNISDLPNPNSIPNPSFEFVECYGVQHRTVDYARNRENLDWPLRILKSTKIGGRPPFHGISRGWDKQRGHPMEFIDDLDQLLEGRHICTLSAIQPNPFFDYPFTNRSECLTLKRYNERDKTLILVDMGCLFVYLTDDGKINHRFQCG